MAQRILLCEDEMHILRAAEFKLKRSGFDVYSAANGEQAWNLLQKQPLPDLLITDCQMPMLDGLGLLERIRAHERTSQLSVVMLTAKGYELSREDLQQRFGILDLLIKPFSPRELVKQVEGYLGIVAKAER